MQQVCLAKSQRLFKIIFNSVEFNSFFFSILRKIAMIDITLIMLKCVDDGFDSECV